MNADRFAFIRGLHTWYLEKPPGGCGVTALRAYAQHELAYRRRPLGRKQRRPPATFPAVSERTVLVDFGVIHQLAAHLMKAAYS